MSFRRNKKETQRRLEQIETQFGAMQRRLGQIEARLDALEAEAVKPVWLKQLENENDVLRAKGVGQNVTPFARNYLDDEKFLLPSTKDIAGLVPDMAGDETAEEYVRKLRDG